MERFCHIPFIIAWTSSGTAPVVSQTKGIVGQTQRSRIDPTRYLVILSPLRNPSDHIGTPSRTMPPKGLRRRGLSLSSYLSVSAEIRREQCPSDSERLRDSSIVELPRNASWQHSGHGTHRLVGAGTHCPTSWDNPSLSTASALNHDRLLFVESLNQSLLEYAQIADKQERAVETGRGIDQETVADSLDSQTLLLQETEGVARVIRAKDASTIPRDWWHRLAEWDKELGRQRQVFAEHVLKRDMDITSWPGGVSGSSCDTSSRVSDTRRRRLKRRLFPSGAVAPQPESKRSRVEIRKTLGKAHSDTLVDSSAHVPTAGTTS
jgi:hypothetical protein